MDNSFPFNEFVNAFRVSKFLLSFLNFEFLFFNLDNRAHRLLKNWRVRHQNVPFGNTVLVKAVEEAQAVELLANAASSAVWFVAGPALLEPAK